MISSKEIKVKIVSIRKIQKITKAMQNIAASKMRRAKQRMLTTMPYAIKIREVAQNIAVSDQYSEHPYLKKHGQICKVGYIVVSTDRGLCGGLNLNLFKLLLNHAQALRQQQISALWCLFGKKAEVFFQNLGVDVRAHADSLGELPRVEDLLGSIKVMLDSYKTGELNQLFIAHNEFVSTITQRPVIRQLLPLAANDKKVGSNGSYIYEPHSCYDVLLDMVITRYIEAQVYQALVDNIACEQVARMVAMQNATANCKSIIDELQILYNKARQNTITNEIAEIVGGAKAV